MKNTEKTKEQLLKEIEKLNNRITDLEKSETKRLPDGQEQAGKQAEEKIKHLNLILNAIRNVNQLIIKEKNRNVLIQKTCEILTENRGYTDAWIVLLGKQGEYLNSAESGLGKSFIPVKKMLKKGKLTNCVNKTLKKRDLVITEDSRKECGDCPLFANYNKRSCYSISLRHDDTIYGLLTVSVPKFLINDKEEQNLFQEVGEDIAFAIYNMELEEKRKQAEETLRNSEKRIRNLMESVPIGISISTPEGDITEVNTAIWKIFDYDFKEEFINTPSEAHYYNPKDRERFIELHKKGLIKDFEIRFKHKDGTVFWGSVTSTTLLTEDGKTEFINTFMDITKRKQAEEALQKSEKQLQILIDTMPDFVCFKDGDGRWLKVNNAGIRIFQLEGVDYQGKKDSELAELNSKLQNSFLTCKESDARAWKEGNIVQGEETVPDPDGSVRVFDVTKVPVIHSNGDRKGLVVLGHDITERKKAEEKNARSSRIFEDSLNEIYLFNADTLTYIQVNNAAQHNLGYTMEELQKLTTLDINPELTSESFAKLAAPLRKGEKGKIVFETVHKRKNQSLYNVEVHLQLLIYDQKLIFTAIILDITERKQAEKALKEQQRYTRGLIEANLDAFVMISVEGKITDLNSAMELITGISRKKIINTDFSNYFTDPDAARKGYQQVFSDGYVKDYPLEFKHSDGKVTSVLYNANIYKDRESNILGVFAVARDITERKQVEEALRESEAKYRFLIEHSNDAIYLLYNRKFEIINNEFIQMFGYTLKEVNKPGFDFIQLVATKSRQSVEDRSKRIARGEKLKLKYEFTAVTKNGKELEVEVSVTYIDYKTGKATQGIIRNITERKKIEKELQEYRDNLEELVEKRTAELSFANAELAKAAGMKDEFLANMSHELRTPLNAVLGLSEALQEEIYGKLNQKQTEKIQHIEESGRHLLDLINEILDLAKIEAGKIVLEYSRISVEELIQSSLRFIKQVAFKKKIKVSTSISGTIKTFRADEKRMKQILVNLLNNAVKFTPDEGQIGLEVDVNEENQTISFIVWDTGIGISQKNIDKLFQPFVQVDSTLSRQYEGTGLGLALVDKLINMHNGSITVGSKEGEGSRFIVTIPIMEYESKESELEDSKIDITESGVLTVKEDVREAKEGKKLILLAEDNKRNIITIKDYLEAKQFQVVVARNGKEAVEKAHEVKPNLILMDIQMPVMNGLEATKEIRASNNSKISGIPIIALTSLVMPGDKEKCFNAGVDDYMKKPVGLKNLVKNINDLLEKKT